MTDRRFPPPWTVVPMPGGFKVVDAEQLLAYRYARQTRADADTAKVLTMDEALGSGQPRVVSCAPRAAGKEVQRPAGRNPIS